MPGFSPTVSYAKISESGYPQGWGCSASSTLNNYIPTGTGPARDMPLEDPCLILKSHAEAPRILRDKYVQSALVPSPSSLE